MTSHSRSPADQRLDQVLEQLSTIDPHESQAVAGIGSGPLEEVVRAHGKELWPRIEQLARDDTRFRRALASVWAYESPEYEVRHQLLIELAEYLEVEVRFEAYKRGSDEHESLKWRALEIPVNVPANQLAKMLRGIADSIERDVDGGEGRQAISGRAERRAFREWKTVRNALDSVYYRLISGDLSSLGDAETLRSEEEAAWRTMARLLSDGPPR